MQRVEQPSLGLARQCGAAIAAALPRTERVPELEILQSTAQSYWEEFRTGRWRTKVHAVGKEISIVDYPDSSASHAHTGSVTCRRPHGCRFEHAEAKGDQPEGIDLGNGTIIYEEITIGAVYNSHHYPCLHGVEPWLSNWIPVDPSLGAGIEEGGRRSGQAEPEGNEHRSDQDVVVWLHCWFFALSLRP
jgi:hypothetical protein